MTLTRSHLPRAALFSFLVLVSFFAKDQTFHPVSAQTTFATNVQGTVTEALTGRPIPGAHVQAANLNLSAVTDAGGQFAWNAIPLPQATFTTTITIAASGFGDWMIQDVRLQADDTLLLTSQLGASPTVIVAPLPRSERPEAPQDQPPPDFVRALADHTNVPLPATIRVRVTGWGHCDLSRPYTVQTIDFRTYLQHVLPNEWGSTWAANSLRAGAMAAKMYAWYWVAVGGKWPDADVYDSTCDQVYNPNIARTSTNAAIDYTWNWRLMRGNEFVITYYRAYHSQCPPSLAGNCMGQYDSKWMADTGSTWDQILYYFYTGSSLSQVPSFGHNFALNFNGNGTSDIDRVKIQIDDPTNSNPGPPADIGATDFTIEWWMKADAADNSADAVTCGYYNSDWIYGNTIIDRDRYNQYREYGISIADGKLVLGIIGEGTGDVADMTLCGTVTVADGQWHHVAVERRRSDGFLWIWVDGNLDVSSDGPDGDISYPDDGVPNTDPNANGCACATDDPYLVFGAKKHDANPNAYPSYDGWLEEVRLSKILRYTSSFQPPIQRFTSDADTVALYHFDNASAPGPCTGQIVDSASSPSHGACHYGGSPAGPLWGVPFIPAGPYRAFLPFVLH